MTPSPACAALAALAAGLLVWALALRRARASARADSAARERELAELKARPLEVEYRIERFDVLWYPVVTADPAARRVLKTLAGSPHCARCSVRLKSTGAERGWACPECGFHVAAALADLQVTDTVAQEALRYFLQRRKDYSP